MANLRCFPGTIEPRTKTIHDSRLTNMCGITGWATSDSNLPVRAGDRDLLHSMCERMAHRGPDSEGLFVTNGAALGMRRLAIIDLVTGEQPAFNEDKTIAVIL